MKRFRGKLTYANVMATIAVFLVLGGGTALAAKEALLPKNSIGAKQIKPGAVTPAKLSPTSRAALIGPAGPKGDPGPRGERGVKGPEGPPGGMGMTGDEPFVVAAEGKVSDVRTTSGIPLSGTTSWTTTSGGMGLLAARFTASLAKEPGGYICEAHVAIFDDGNEVGHFFIQQGEEFFSQSSVSLPGTPIAIDEPGLHTITAESYGSTECQAGSEITSLHVVVAPLGR
jgi:hypothetical protein